MDTVVVLIAAGGAAWESTALAALDGRRGVVVLKRCVDIEDLLATASAGQADVALVGLDDPGFDATAVEQLQRHRVRPVAVVPPAVLEAGRLRAARVGVRTVVPADELGHLTELLAAGESAVEEPVAQQRPVDDGPSMRGRVIAVWGPAGAPGRTTLATGLAAQLGASGEPVTLIDADPYGGSVGQVLGVLDEVSGVLAAARFASSGVLAERFASVVRRVGPGLEVVTGLPRADRWVEVRPGTVEALVEVARARGHVVLDTGFTLEADPMGDFSGRPGRNYLTQAALAVADEVVVVGAADPVGLARLARAVAELREELDGLPVRVVVNRMRPTLGWSRDELSVMVAGFTTPTGVHFLPDDQGCVDRALATGQAFGEVAPDAPLVCALDDLAEVLVPRVATRRPRRSLLRRRTATRARRP